MVFHRQGAAYASPKWSVAVTNMLIAGACLLALGCGSSREPTFPVRGSVFCDGQPAIGATVHFHLASDDADKDHSAKRPKNPAAVPYAIVDETGDFEVTTFKEGDGAKEGDYRVTISWTQTEMVDNELIVSPDKLGGIYSRPETTKFLVTVERGDNEIPRFEVKLPPPKNTKQANLGSTVK